MFNIHDNPATRANAIRDWRAAARIAYPTWESAVAVLAHTTKGDDEQAAFVVADMADLPTGWHEDEDATDWLRNGAWSGDETPKGIKAEWDNLDK